MTAAQEFASWRFPSQVQVNPVPDVNASAPKTSEIPFPRKDAKPVVIAFLRHCGCPCMNLSNLGCIRELTWVIVAEKTFLSLRKQAEENKDVHCIAVSHSDKPSTDKWVESVGGAGNIEVVVDAERTIYGQYGLGVASFWHVLNPWSLGAVFTMAKNEKIKNRPTESGTRWQTSGVYAIDASGVVKYSHSSATTDDLGDLEAAVQAVQSAA